LTEVVVSDSSGFFKKEEEANEVPEIFFFSFGSSFIGRLFGILNPSPSSAGVYFSFLPLGPTQGASNGRDLRFLMPPLAAMT